MPTTETARAGRQGARFHPIGRRRWAIAQGSVCILNASDEDAHIDMTAFFGTREPAGPFRIVVPARRTRHLQFDELTDPETLPQDVDYACVLESDVPIVVQHTRLEAGEPPVLIATIGYGEF